MKRLLSLDKLTEKQRLLVLLTIGTLATIITVIVTRTPEKVAVTPIVPSKNINQGANIPIKPVKPTGKQVIPAENALRDPFALPPEYRGQKYPTDFASPMVPGKELAIVTHEKNNSNNPKESFKLTGIICTADKRLAVISSANKSKAYQLDEFIGRYQLRVINEESVILTGNDQDLVLRLESAQK